MGHELVMAGWGRKPHPLFLMMAFM